MVFKIRSLTLDAAAKKTLKGKFKPSTAAERRFQKQLVKVAKHAGHIVDLYTKGGHEVTPGLLNTETMQRHLAAYAKAIEPWAARQSLNLLNSVAKSNKRAYNQKSKAIGLALRAELGETEVGQVSAMLMLEQVGLITSIPLEAGLRAQKIAYEAVLSGRRAEVNSDTVQELQKQLGLSTEVATSRAKLIAVTETARANASISQARAMKVGSSQYRWHNSGDEAVRHSHKFYKGKRMQGQIFSWDNPPTLDDGMTGHPGTFPRCRCWAEPIFDEE